MNGKKRFYTTGAILLLLLAMFYGGWRAFFAPDEILRQKLMQELGVDFFDLTETVGGIDHENRAEITPVKTSKPSNPVTSHEEADPMTPATPSSPEPPPEEFDPASPETPDASAVAPEEITDRYRLRLEHLEQTVVGRLEILTGKAMTELTEQRMLGTDNKSALARKYIQAVQMLEEAVDQHFHQIMTEMEIELTAHQYPTEILRELEDHYKQQRQEQRSMMMEQARLFM